MTAGDAEVLAATLRRRLPDPVGGTIGERALFSHLVADLGNAIRGQMRGAFNQERFSQSCGLPSTPASEMED